MKKGCILLLVIPFLCSCSGRVISNEDAYKIVNNFETKLEQTTTFAYYERKAILETSSTKTVTFYQVFFQENFIHSYTINEDSDVSTNNSAVEQWTFIRDGMIYEVTTDNSEKSSKGKIYNAYTYEKELWEGIMKNEFEEVKKTNIMYYIRLKSELRNIDDKVKITSRSKNKSSLNEKIETTNLDGKIIRTKLYNFEESLITEINEKDDYSTKLVTFKYHVTTQEVMYPDF